jgi:hypothetical protein
MKDLEKVNCKNCSNCNFIKSFIDKYNGRTYKEYKCNVTKEHFYGMTLLKKCNTFNSNGDYKTGGY